MVIGWEPKKAFLLAMVSVPHFFRYFRGGSLEFPRFLVDSCVYSDVLYLGGFSVAKIDFNVDFTHKLCAALMLPSPRFHFLSETHFYTCEINLVDAAPSVVFSIHLRVFMWVCISS